MVNQIPRCSVCTRQNGITIHLNGTIENITDQNDRFSHTTCPQGYQCLSSNAAAKLGCCRLCPSRNACPEGTVGDSFESNLCPDGHICDPFPTKCSVGEVCSKNKLTNCTKTQQLFSNLGHGSILNGVYCEGSAYIRNCPTGYYCPNAREKIECPKGFFCPMKSKAPEITCAMCQQGSLKLQRDWHNFATFVGISIGVIILGAILKKVYLSREKTKLPISDASISKTASDSSVKSLANKGTHDKNKERVIIRYENISFMRRSRNGNKPYTTIVNNLSGTMRPGRLCALLGESGAGKSTLLAMLSGQIKLWHSTVKGKIIINGKDFDILDWIGSEHSQKLTALVPQDDILHNQLSVYENLFWSGRILMSSGKTKNDVKAEVRKYLNLLGLMHVQDSPVNSISGGEKRRTSIGVALMTRPRVLFCDEATSGLDASNSMSVMSVLKTITQTESTTIICSIHQPRQAIFENFDDLVLMGRGGKMLYAGCAQNASNHFRTLGYTCPPEVNFADFLLDLSTSGKESNSTCTSLLYDWNKGTGEHDDDKTAVNELLTVKELTKNIINPTPMRQTYFHLSRNLSILKRDYRRVIINTVSVCLASIVLTTTLGTPTIVSEEHEYLLTQDELTTDVLPLVKLFQFTASPILHSHQIALAMSLGVGVLTALAASKTMSDQKAVIFREIDSGFDVSSYFVATSVYSIFESGIQAVLAGALSYWIRNPLQHFLPYVLNFFFLQFGCVSHGHLITTLVPPDNLPVVLGSIMLSSGLLCSGFIAPLTMEKVYSSNLAALLTGLLSPVRYFAETFVVSDFLCLPKQYGYTVEASDPDDVPPETVFDALYLAMNDRSTTRFSNCNGWYYGMIRLCVTGIMIRSLTLLVIQITYRRQSLSWRRCRLNKWFILHMVIFISLFYISVRLILT